jgi:hypothetical protein
VLIISGDHLYRMYYMDFLPVINADKSFSLLAAQAIHSYIDFGNLFYSLIGKEVKVSASVACRLMTGDSFFFSETIVHDSGVALHNRIGVLDTLKFLSYVKQSLILSIICSPFYVFSPLVRFLWMCT